MLESERNERRIVRRVFGPDAELEEYGSTGELPGQVQIRLDGALLGSGQSFAKALCDAMAFVLPGVGRASDLIRGTGDCGPYWGRYHDESAKLDNSGQPRPLGSFQHHPK